MLFPSVLFIVYFLPTALLLYLLCSFSRQAQNLCLLALSLFFYAWGEPLHLVPLLFDILVAYGLGRMLAGEKSKEYRKKVVLLGVVLILGMLFVVRYGSAFVQQIGELAAQVEVSGLPFLTGLASLSNVPSLTPPLGVSFFSLQALAYIFDSARGKIPPEKSIFTIGLHIAFFPTVLAGPVVRYTDIAAQIQNRKISGALLGKGCSHFVIGLGKLLLVAGPASAIAEHIFSMSTVGAQIAVPVLLAWLGLLALSLQVYFAFSAYADMAIGTAAMFGFSIQRNVDYPYAARTVTDFWKRFNITLYRWFYLYVFIVLGGSRPKRVRVRGVMRPRNFILRNLFCMWLLLGLWYGLSWTFLFWGLWFFVFCLFEWIVRLPHRKLRNPAWHVYVVLVVCFGWIFFRCHSVGESMSYLSNMLGLGGNGFYSDLALLLLRENWLPLAFGIVFCMPVAQKAKALMSNESPIFIRYPMAVIYPLTLLGLFALSMIYLMRGVRIPFIL